MNYKELFNKMAFLLSSPSRFWEKEATEGQGSRMMSEYVYPLIGLCGLSEFIGTFIGRDVSTEFFQWALTRCCAIAVSLCLFKFEDTFLLLLNVFLCFDYGLFSLVTYDLALLGVLKLR
jgi:hypothetical protein